MSATYSCDKCRSRKVSCSRNEPKCDRCVVENVPCIYSRSGVIRRNRKPKHANTTQVIKHSQARQQPTINKDEPECSVPPSLLANDIEATRERLRGLDNQHDSLGALSGLSEAYAAIWHSDSEIEQNSGEFFLMEERATFWCYTFETTLLKGHPLFIAPPADVLALLKASQPRRIKNRAWLVMYYSIILSMISSTDPSNHTLKTKLRANLWLALNDVRLLLEPSEMNIQALTLLASHVEEFTTPSLSWMLMTNACRMLQAIGINHRRLDAKTRERRTMMFWHLNLVDKGLALSLGRPPTFHRAMAREIPLPSLEQFLPFHPHKNPATKVPSLFGAHLLQQVFISTRIQADIWYCLFEDVEVNDQSIALAAEDLERWYSTAQRVLEAAAFSEKPFLDVKSAASVDLGLRTGTFTYHYLRILLAKSSSQMKGQCIESSRAMLHLLDDMVSDSEEPFNGIIWQLVCRPFTPFLVLFGEILAGDVVDDDDKEILLNAMERLPIFLNKMALRNSLAAKLERVAVTFMQHARSLVKSSTEPLHERSSSPSVPARLLTEDWPGVGSMLHWDAFFDQATVPMFNQQGASAVDATVDNLEAWTTIFFEDTVFDWIGFENQV